MRLVCQTCGHEKIMNSQPRCLEDWKCARCKDGRYYIPWEEGSYIRDTYTRSDTEGDVMVEKKDWETLWVNVDYIDKLYNEMMHWLYTGRNIECGIKMERIRTELDKLLEFIADKSDKVEE